MDTDDVVLGVFQRELAEAEKENADANKILADTQKRVQTSSQSITSLKHLITVRQQKLQALESEAAAAQEQIDGAEVTATKTNFVLKMIQDHPLGVTPAEIKDAGLMVGFDGSSNFPYTTLSKLKIAKKIKEELGKYFPVTN